MRSRYLVYCRPNKTELIPSAGAVLCAAREPEEYIKIHALPWLTLQLPGMYRGTA
jgi:hypothetical protein